MYHTDDTAEKYEEAMIAATRRHFSVIVAELADEGIHVDRNEANDNLWKLAEEFAETELAQQERDAEEYA